MRSLPRLTRLFRAITSVTAISGTVVACSSSGASRDGIDENVCTNGAFVPGAGITPKVPVDYFAIAYGNPSSPTNGTACATAKDNAACQAKLKTLLTDDGRGFNCGQVGCSVMAYTRGDEVGVLRTIDDLKSFLSFRSLADAALIAYSSGHTVECSKDNANTTASGYQLITSTGSGCGASDDVKENRIFVSKAGDLTVEESVVTEEGDPGCAIGRRPEGLHRPPLRRHAGVGRWLAEVAHLEAASVIAFERLAEELEALGAPAPLVAMARASADDEVRHARVTTKLAKRYGAATVAEPCVDPRPRRSLFEVALENAIEGCVRETFGALVATFQMGHAESADIRAAMYVIARDETKHSALAWEIAAWAESLLTAEQRAEVEAARRDAAAKLRRELQVEPHADVQRLAGMPKASDALTMFDAAARELWAA